MVLVGVFVLSPDALILRLVGTDRWSLIFWRGLLTALTLLICFVAIYRRDVFKYLGAIGRYGLVGGFISATCSILFVTSIVLTSVAKLDQRENRNATEGRQQAVPRIYSQKDSPQIQ